MFQALTLITTITGLFTILDLFVEKNARAKVAEYVFGFGSVDLSGFEHNVIQSLLSPLKIDNKLSVRRLFFRYSLLVAALFSTIHLILVHLLNIELLQSANSTFVGDLVENIVAIPLIALIFWPFDIWSIWVTNNIFGQSESGTPIKFFFRTLKDVFMTLLPLLVIGIFLALSFKPLMSIYPDLTPILFTIVIMFGLVNCLGSLLITIVQLSILVTGILTRNLLKLTRINQRIAMVSRAPEFPFTFIGFCIAFAVSTYVAIAGSNTI